MGPRMKRQEIEKMTTMPAMVIDEHGPAEPIHEAEVPTPSPASVDVRTHPLPM